MRRIMKLSEYRINESAEGMEELNIDDSIIEELVELVGSEEDIEAAAEAAYNDLMAAAEADEVEMNEEDVPEKLAIAALIVKLVEMGKLGPDEADSFIANNLD
jgi:hypothetical protein